LNAASQERRPVRVKPTKDRILVERLDGHGIERTTRGGIIVPATNEARAKTKRDGFRARVLVLGPEVPKGLDLKPGEHVLVHMWAEGDGKKLYTGDPLGGAGLLIRPDDIICVVDKNAHAEVV
jgi:co-chaperonin GroES (HSP10)